MIKHPREDKKDKDTNKSPRETCTECKKPAVRYYTNEYTKDGALRRRIMVFEHRDELPVKEYWYTTKKGKKQHHFRYRRCNAGVVTEGIPLISEQQAPPPQPKVKSKSTNISSRAKHFSSHTTKLIEALEELQEILYDTSGEEAKRILKNVRRWVPDKIKELQKEELHEQKHQHV